jgi:AcrR family transcriptional regulator
MIWSLSRFAETILMNNSRSRSRPSRPYHHGDLRRCLVDAAVALVAEDQDWTFSLREVARRAGVSHNAPYNHFADKRDLLAEVAAAGFDALRRELLVVAQGIEDAQRALVMGAVVYVNFGIKNPAHYRLMFGSVLAPTLAERPERLAVAGANAKAVLEEIIHRGARQGVFFPSPKNKEQLSIAVISAWSAVHGLTMLAIDGLAETPSVNTSRIAEKMADALCWGLNRR